MADTMNQQIADALVVQQLRVARVEAQQRRDVWALLALLETDLLAALKANDPTQWALLARRRRAVEVLMAEELDPLVTARYAQIAAQLDAVMLRMATHEATQVQDIVNEATGEATIVEVPSTRQLRAGVVDGLFPSTTKPTDQATTASAWWTRQGAGLVQRLGDSLIVGVALEESLTHLTQRVRGTSMLGFQDGLMAKARQDAARLLTTQMTNTIGEARVAVAARNPAKLVLVHESILDSRTSLVCLGRDGLKYDPVSHEGIGHDIPYLSGVPYHPGCRSTMETIVDNGGTVQKQSMTTWLQRRDTAFQDEVLGPARAQLFRAGALTGKSLLDAATGRPLTLEELGA